MGNFVNGSDDSVVAITREYYNSSDADEFYFRIWGGEDIHVGIYLAEDEPIATASRRSVETMTKQLNISAASKVLDLGSGYGGAARYLAEKFKCKIVCLNLSETENERNRELNKKMNLNEFIEVVDADFAEIPYSQDSFDIVWSEDAILHSPKKEKVFQEVARILKPGGDFIFTDPMQADNVPAGVLQPVLDRIHLQSMGSFSQYTKLANQLNLKKIKIEDLSTHLTRHYTRVKEELIHKKQLLEGHVSESYSEKMLSGLQHWIEAGKKGYLAWGILHFQKPA